MYRQQKKYRQALEEYTRASRVIPNRTEANRLAVEMILESGVEDLRMATSLCEQMTKDNKLNKDWRVPLACARLHSAKDQAELSEKEVQLALEYAQADAKAVESIQTAVAKL